MTTSQRIFNTNIVQGDLETIAAGAGIYGAHFAQARMPGANVLDIDLQIFQARYIQPALCRQTEQSRQGQPEQEEYKQHGWQPARGTSKVNWIHVSRILLPYDSLVHPGAAGWPLRSSGTAKAIWLLELTVF